MIKAPWDLIIKVVGFAAEEAMIYWKEKMKKRRKT